MMKKICIYLITLLMTISIGFAESFEQEYSHFKSLKSCGKLDSNSIKKYLQIAEKLTRTDIRKAESFTKEILDISIKIDLQIAAVNASIILANIYSSNLELDKAQNMANNVLKYAEKSHSRFYKFTGLFLLGNINYSLQDYNNAMKYYSDALNYTDNSKANEMNVALVYINLASIMQWRESYKEALKYGRQALQLLKKNTQNTYVPFALNSVGSSFLSMNEIDSAEYYLTLCVKLAKKNKDYYTYNQANGNLAIVYARSGRKAAATKIIEEQLTYTQNEEMEISLLCNLAGYYVDLHRINDAKNILDSISIKAKKSNLLDNLVYIYECYSDLYSSAKKFDKALEYYKIRSNLKDSLQNIESIAKIDELNIKYNSAKKEYEIKKLNSENELSKQFGIIASAVALLIFLSTIIIAFLLRKRSKLAKSLTVSNTSLQLAVTEINRQKEELVHTNEKLRQSNADKNTFLGIAAHDLKNPLQGITLSAYAIKQYPEKFTHEKLTDTMSKIENASSRMSNIISDLLLVNNLESSAEMKKEQFDPNSVLQEIIAIEIPHIENKGLIFSQELLQNVKINYNEYAFREIFDNLLSNAVKYSPKYSTVAVKSYMTETNSYCLSIKDSGPGFSKEDEKKIFQKFSKLSAKPTDGENFTGLGLSIVKELSNKMNSKIYYKTVLGVGTEFFIEIDNLDTITEK